MKNVAGLALSLMPAVEGPVIEMQQQSHLIIYQQEQQQIVEGIIVV